MSDVVDLDAFRSAREKKASATTLAQVKARLRIEDGAIEYDHPGLDRILVFSPELADEFARTLLAMAREVRRLALPPPAAASPVKVAPSATAAVVGAPKRTRKLGPLKVSKWMLQTLGGYVGSTDPQWVSMGGRRDRLNAERLIESYVEHGFARTSVRIVPVDSRGRLIPPDRMRQ